MSAQEKTEDVLRRIHILFSKALPYGNSKRTVIVDKNDMMDLLKELNSCMYELQEEYEMTAASRDKADRKQAKKNEDMLFEAKRNADDIYAASVMYSDRSLVEVEDGIDAAVEQMNAVHEELLARMEEKKQEVRRNRLELKGTLSDLIDTQKYIHLIEDENARLAKAKASGQPTGYAEDEAPMYADVQPEIIVNQDYFQETGTPMDDIGEGASNVRIVSSKGDAAAAGADTQAAGASGSNGSGTEAKSAGSENSAWDGPASGAAGAPLTEEQIKAMSEDLDNDYFNWKDGQADTSEKDEKKKHSFPFFGKKND